MDDHRVVSREEWLAARREHLAKEKAFTRARDELSRDRRELPWVRVDKQYVFHGPQGDETLADLFEGRSQLIVYHFMFHPSWEEGCKSCSFWADNYDRIIVHLNHRDVSMVTVSRAPLAQLEAFRRRLGWSFKWVSSHDSDFNQDFDVTFSPEQVERREAAYNYGSSSFPMEEAPGMSVFYRQGDSVYHTYSCYSRGLDMLNGAYHHLDLVPKGRDEAAHAYNMEWLRTRDRYED